MSTEVFLLVLSFIVFMFSFLTTMLLRISKEQQIEDLKKENQELLDISSKLAEYIKNDSTNKDPVEILSNLDEETISNIEKTYKSKGIDIKTYAKE